MNRAPSTIPDRVPSVDFDHRVKEAIATHMSNEDFRKRVKEIFEDCTDSVPFMDKVRGYAKRELDERIFKNGTSILVWIASLILAAILGAFATKYIH